MKKADKEYKEYAYFEAREIYEKVAKKGYKSVDLFTKLGDSYYFNAQLPEAGNYYGQLFDLNETIQPEYYYRYAQCLKSMGDYKKANEYLDKFAKFFELCKITLIEYFLSKMKDQNSTNVP